MSEDLLSQLQSLRQMFADVRPTDPAVCERYGWIIAKGLTQHCWELGSRGCRQLLAEYLTLPLARPSRLHSSLLASAIKVASMFHDFHFARFLVHWGPENLRPEDYERFVNKEGKSFLSLAEKLLRTYMTSLLLYPDDRIGESAAMDALAERYGYSYPVQMIVSHVNAVEKNGRKMLFAGLYAADGTELSCEIHNLKAELTPATAPDTAPPTQSAPRHYVNVGQVYDVVTRRNSEGTATYVAEALLLHDVSKRAFAEETGYVEHYDEGHGFTHIYDGKSRHFVSSGQRMRLVEGQYVRFIPVIPKGKTFKSAIVTRTLTSAEGPEAFGLRSIRITNVNAEKGYCAWELSDDKGPIAELLTDGTLSNGHTTGFANLSLFTKAGKATPGVGDTYRVTVFLKRGKDREKRPRVVNLL